MNYIVPCVRFFFSHRCLGESGETTLNHSGLTAHVLQMMQRE